jgi:selenocysteine lyase/cysteine desulfurase
MVIDLLAFPGHKGALGPLGTGGLYIRPGLEGDVDPLREGGTGSRSEEDVQPAGLPDKYEAGSQNAVGIAGLSEGVRWHLEHGATDERGLVEQFLAGLRELDALGEKPGRHGLRLVGPTTAEGRTGVFSLMHESMSPHELATIMEQEFGILGRAGLHCAPRAHGALGTMPNGGAYRLSLGPFVTADDVRFAISSVAEVIGAPRGAEPGERITSR